jgi:hypothetical protein
MSWQDDIDAAHAEKRRAEKAKQEADQAARSAESERLARVEPQLAALEQVRTALVRSKWPGAHRSRERLFQPQRVAEMPVTEIVEQSGDNETGFVEVMASITYYKHPSPAEALIFVKAGTYVISGENRVGNVLFSGSRWQELTPDLIKRAAARYCVTRGVQLSLE